MKRFWLTVLLILLAGCDDAPNRRVTAVPSPSPTTIPDLPTTTPDPHPPTLFANPWDDRELFRAGLIPDEQGVLAGLPGATVYHLDLHISDSLDSVIAAQELRYTNQERETLNEVRFHLYPNLLGGRVEVTAVSVNDLPTSPTFTGVNDSVMSVPLTAPLTPGETAVIRFNFTATVPQGPDRNYAVFAFNEGVLALAHFYPMVAVYEQDWYTDTPSPQGDLTYGDSAFFLVRVTLPADVVLAAGGSTLSHSIDGAQQTMTIAAGPVRDFYLAASRDYVVASRQIGNTLVNSYALAGYEEGGTAVLDYASAALAIFSRRFSPYPYTELDVVSTTTSALGVEYPGIFANTVRIYDLEGSTGTLPNSVRLESTTVHETAHQWFYSLVGNDQLNEPWLDEALTQYSVYLYYQDNGGATAANGYYSYLENFWGAVDSAPIPIGLPVAEYAENEYGPIVYGRGPIFVRQLEEEMGTAVFQTFLRDYVQQNRWGIATTVSFQALAEEHCQCELGDLFDEWVYEK